MSRQEHRIVVRRFDASRAIVFYALSVDHALAWIAKRSRPVRCWIEYQDQPAHRPRESIAFLASQYRLRRERERMMKDEPVE